MALPKQRSSSSSSFTRILSERDRLPTPWVHPRPSRMTQPWVDRSLWGRSIIRGKAGLTRMCVQAVCRGLYGLWSPPGREGGLCDFKRVLGPFKASRLGTGFAKPAPHKWLPRGCCNPGARERSAHGRTVMVSPTCLLWRYPPMREHRRSRPRPSRRSCTAPTMPYQLRHALRLSPRRSRRARG